MNDFTKIKDGDIVTGEDGPLWYRGLAQGDEAALAGDVEKVLQAFGVKRIVIGHTPTAGTVIPRFDGRVVMIDVGLSAYYGSRRACLVLEPAAGPSAYLSYLKQAAALDPAPSPLAEFARALEASLAKTR